MIRSVSLDLGGTLVTEVESRPAIYAAEARRLGLDVSDQRMAQLMRAAHHHLPEVLDGSYRYSDPWFEQFISRIFRLELGVANGELTTLTERLFTRFQSAETFRLFPGVDALLGGLRRLGLRVGVLSNWSARLPRVLDALGLAQAFDFVVCSALDRVEKPDRRAFELAAARAGVAPHECLHAGDRVDLDGAARAAQCNFVLVRHPGAAREANDDTIHESFDIVDGLPQLLEYVEERVA
jgi:putative hydrolase of the HAD superfamily